MDSVDAAFVWPHNDKTYFFQGIHYWRYDDHLRRMDPGYPKDASLWKGLPPNLDDAMRWSDGGWAFNTVLNGMSRIMVNVMLNTVINSMLSIIKQ